MGLVGRQVQNQETSQTSKQFKRRRQRGQSHKNRRAGEVSYRIQENAAALGSKSQNNLAGDECK